jgi:hypothetical protein
VIAETFRRGRKREEVFQLIEMTTTSWTPSACPIPDMRPVAFRGIRVSVGSAAAYSHTTGLDLFDAGVTRGKNATTGGMAWGPPV